jgi:hypothetical protein
MSRHRNEKKKRKQQSCEVKNHEQGDSFHKTNRTASGTFALFRHFSGGPWNFPGSKAGSHHHMVFYHGT